MSKWTNSDGKPIIIDEEINSGGEATIHRVKQQPQAVAKIYREGKHPPADKIEYMLKEPIARSKWSLLRQHTFKIIWPSEAIYEGERTTIAHWVRFLRPQSSQRADQSTERPQLIGFLMELVSGTHQILNVYNPIKRKELFPKITQKDMYRIAANIAEAFDFVHTKGYVIGDVNQKNILINEKLCVILIDTDSFQVGSYRCEVGVPEFTPPELQSCSLKDIERAPAHDCFGLAVLIFQLLHDGSHPFRGQWIGAGKDPSLAEKIRDNYFPHDQKDQSQIKPPGTIPALDTLDPALAELFRRCFIAGHHNPSQRPTATEWWSTLQEAQRNLRECKQNAFHYYDSRHTNCPYCQINPSTSPASPHSPVAVLQRYLTTIRSGLRYIIRNASFYREQVAQNAKLWGMWTLGSVIGGLLVTVFDGRGAVFVQTNGQPDFSGLTVLIIGVAQWWALGTRITGKRRWALIVVASLFVLNMMFQLLTPGVMQLDTLLQQWQAWVATTQPAIEPLVEGLRGVIPWAATGLIAGFTIGAVQWIRLRLYINRASWWVIINMLAWTGSVLTLAATSTLWLSNLVLGALTGVGLVILLWNTRNNILLRPRRLQWNLTGILAYSGVVLAILAHFITIDGAPPNDPPSSRLTVVPPRTSTIPTVRGPTTTESQLDAGTQMRVDTDGRNALVRANPGTTYTVLTRLPDGTIVTLLGETAEADGFIWQHIRTGTMEGWLWDELLIDINQ